MIISNGKNDFKNNTFDKFRWSANTYETGEEIIAYFREIGIFDKKVKGITAIGAMINYSLGNWKSKAEQSLRDAGIIIQSERYERRKRRVTLCDGSVHDLGNCLNLLKNASTERSVTLYEPLLILFEDGNILELLPCASRGLRIGYNTLPREMRNGVNRCEFDIGVLFNSFISGQRLFMVDVISTVANVTYSGNRKNSVCKRDEFRLYFSSGYLRLEELQCSEYKLSFPSVDLIKCGELAELGEQSYQEQILEGSHGGASVNIYPVNGTERVTIIRIERS